MSVAALRSLARSRALSATVVATLAVGVAALATTFAVVNAAVLRRPPFPDADRVAMLYLQFYPADGSPGLTRWSYPRFQAFHELQHSFEAVASYAPATLTISGDVDAAPQVINAERASASYFQVLRVQAARGRLFTAAEDNPTQPTPVAVLGHDLWMSRWAGDSSVLGRPIKLNGVTLTVIGVMPPGFAGLSGSGQLWVPETMSAQVSYAEYLTTNQNFISGVGRLRAGVTLEAARSELAVLGAMVNRASPSNPRLPNERVTVAAVTINEARTNATTRKSVFVLLGAMALLHLLACANVTNLLLGRAAARRRESAVRLALGAGEGRLFRQLLSEGLVLASAGTLLGVLLAWWASTVMAPPQNAWGPRNFYGSLGRFDMPAFGVSEVAFAIVLALLTALFVALPPAMSAFRIDVSSVLRGGSRGIAGGGITLRRPSARGIIVGLEAALAMMLVVAAGLLIDSFQRMRRVDIGVQPDHVLTFRVTPSDVLVPAPLAPAYLTRMLDAITRVPGVRSASVDGGAPLAGSANSSLRIVGQPLPEPGQAPPVMRHYVGPDHFVTLGIPVRRGRVFKSTDVAGAPRVTVISETAARRFWPNEDPLGKRVWFGGGSNFNSPDSSAVIIGIVGDVAYSPLDLHPNRASFYTPYYQFTYAFRTVFVRTERDPMSVVAGVRRALLTVDPDLAMLEVQPLGDIMEGSWARHRFDAVLFGGFGLAALVLAASGIFAVLSYAVAMRTREFGVRIALGANTSRVLRLVLREGMAFPIVGLVIGVAASLAATRLLQASLYEISPQEPRVFLGTALTLTLVAAVACLVPAWRATRVDPMEALRAE